MSISKWAVSIALLLLGVAAWPGECATLNVLNNFVTELAKISAITENGTECLFTNPRKGWIFVSLSGKGGAPVAILDDRPEALVWRVNPETAAYEAMQYLDEGQHGLRVEKASGMRLDIRAIPEIAYCYYPTSPHIACYGPYSWTHAGKYVLPHVNTIVSRNPVKPKEFDVWRREGRHWLANASLPGLSNPEAPAADAVYQAWAENSAVTDPRIAGMIVDEFLDSSAAHYQAWSEALARLHDTPGFADKMFYAWCGSLFETPPALEFSRFLMTLGYRFSWERYLREEPTEEKARIAFTREVTDHLTQWQAQVPGIERNLVMCLGYLSAPPESLNVNPSVDYQVFLDMQFHLLATEPAFAGLYGIMEYMADYADEESLRYAQKLFRHYCIEGKRTRFNNDPYILPHLANPDFEKGLDKWRVKPAEEGCIAAKKMNGFSWLEGRYPSMTEGDQFCWMKRSAKAPNQVSQTLKSLERGRLYSVKLISADLQQLGQKKQQTLAIQLEHADIVPEYGFQFTFPSSYSHEVGPYTREHPAYMDFHRLVFRARGKRAKLTINDWANTGEPGGPVGEETVFNFVEVQPFHAP